MPLDASIETVRHPHLRMLYASVAEIIEAVEHLRATLTPEQCVWKPQPGTWNVLECIQHLIVTGNLYHPRIREAIAPAIPEEHSTPFRPSFFGRLFLRSISPESTFKVKTPRVFEPPAALTDPAILMRFLEQQAELVELISLADSVDLNGYKFSSPVTRFVRFTVGEGLTVVVTHQQRHLAQARRLTEHPGFPSEKMDASGEPLGTV